jgi:hypothetical protein
MATRRMISRSMGCSEKFASLQTTENGLADFCHALFPLLVVNADDFGRLQGDAFTVKHTCFPVSQHSVDDFESALIAMHRIGLIVRWQDRLRWFIQIVKFTQHQPGLLRNAKSLYPPPDAAARKHLEQSGDELLASVSNPQQVPAVASKSQHLSLKEGRKEGTRSRYDLDLNGSKHPHNTKEPPIVPLAGGRRKKAKKPNAAEKRQLAMMRRWGRA